MRAANGTVISTIRTIADPIERLLRIAYFLDKYEGNPDTWATVCPEYPPGRWDSVAVGRWFAAKARSQGIGPTSVLQTYIKRPGGWPLGKPTYVPDKRIPCWSFREGSTEITTHEDPDLDSSERTYTVTEWANVLLDGQVVTYKLPEAFGGMTGPETITLTGLNLHALILMAALLGLTDDRPGLKPVDRGLSLKSSREVIRDLDRHYIDDYGRLR